VTVTKLPFFPEVVCYTEFTLIASEDVFQVKLRPLLSQLSERMEKHLALGLIYLSLKFVMQHQQPFPVDDELCLVLKRFGRGKIPVEITYWQVDAPEADKCVFTPDRYGYGENEALTGIIDGGRRPPDLPQRIVLRAD
jgi:hypothetical protein